MPWSTTTYATLQAYAITGALDAAFNTSDDAERDTWLAQLVADHASRIRLAIANRTGQSLDADTSTVPPEFAGLLNLRALQSVYDRANSVLGDNEQRFRLTQGQRDTIRDLEKSLDNVRQVTPSDNPETTATLPQSSGTGAAVVASGTLRASRAQLAGL